MLDPACGWRGEVGRAVVGQSGSILKENLSRHTSGNQREHNIEAKASMS